MSDIELTDPIEVEEVKGPDDAHWGDTARSLRGAETVVFDSADENNSVGDDGEPVKGPDPVVWGG